MDTHDTDICGFLDVKSTRNKYTAQKVRKKALGSSKIWKRFWCTVKKLESGLGAKIQFDSKLNYSSRALMQSEKNNFVIIPPNAVIYRTCSKTKQFAFCISPSKDRKPILSLSADSETESQRWMANIRHLLRPRRHCCMGKLYNVSIVDNAHSKAAGLIGLHGDLITNETGISFTDVYTGEIIETFEWREFGQFHLMTAGRPEDVKRICVIHTTKEFRNGIGELLIFCLDANKLLQDLVTHGRGPKHRQRFLCFNDENFEISIEYNGVINSSLQQKCNTLLCLLNTETDRTSVHNKMIENIYQPEPVNLICNKELNSHSHRQSNISIASGIYEEIDDISPKMSRTIISNIYQDTGKIQCNLRMKPPPLPPRHKQESEYMGKLRVDTKQYSSLAVSNIKKKLHNTKVCMQNTTIIDNSSYVPMSSQLRINTSYSDITQNIKENDYIIMQ